MGLSQNSDGGVESSTLAAEPLTSSPGSSTAGTSLLVATPPPAFFIDDVGAPDATSGVSGDPVGTGADQAVNGPAAASAFGVTGAGVKIGILSDSFDTQGAAALAADEADGALPASGVTVLAEGPAGSTDEGRAMAEVIHSIAPGAQLFFATAEGGEQAFANNITALVNAGVKIIVDDITYFEEPFFQDGGPVDQAIEAAAAKGVQFFTSAGNEASNFLQGNFSPVTTTLPGSSQSVVAENFGGGNPLLSVTIGAGATIVFDLQWAQPFGSFGTGQSAQNSLALEAFDPSDNNAIVASTVGNDTVGGDPVQVIAITNGGNTAADVNLAVVENGGTTPAGQTFKLIALGDGQPVTINSASAGIGSGTVFGHHEIAAEDAVGAVDFSETPAFGQNPAKLEFFSSVGPGEVLFGNNGQPLASPEDPGQVKFTAPDGIATSVVDQSLDVSLDPFFGTSAAAPAAAAVAALVDQEDPSLTFQQVTNILQASALPMASNSAAGTGAGLVQANFAVGAAEAFTAAASVLGGSANFFSLGDVDQIKRTTSAGQLEILGTVNATIEDAAALTLPNGNPFIVDGSTTVAGAGADFFDNGQHDVFLRNGAGVLEVEQVDTNGLVPSGETFQWPGGVPVTVDAGMLVVGAGEDWFGTGQRDVFIRADNGQLFFWQFNPSTGQITDGRSFSFTDGTPFTISTTTEVVGADEDFFGEGQRDAFLRLNTSQLSAIQFNPAGQITAAENFVWASGAPVDIDPGMTVVGAGEDWFGTGQRDIFLRGDDGQLMFWQFNPGNAQITDSRTFTNSDGTPFTLNTGTIVAGADEDFFRGGERDVFLRQSTGQLSVEQFDGAGQLTASENFVWASGALVTIDTGMTVIGAGEDYFGTGQSDVFFRTDTGRLIFWQFNPSDSQITDGRSFTNSNGTPLSIDTGTTVVGGGEDFYRDGLRSDVFLRLADGQLSALEFDGSGVVTRADNFVWASGALVTIDTGMTVVGAGEDFFGRGQSDIFFRGDNGQLFFWEFNQNTSQITDSRSFTLSNGAPLSIDTGTTVVGLEQNLFGAGERDLFLREASGQLVMLGINLAGQVDFAQSFVTQGGSLFTIDSGTTVVAAGSDAATGRNDIVLEAGNGTETQWDISGNTLLNPQSPGAAVVAASPTTGSISGSSTGSAAGAGSLDPLLESQLAQLTQAMAGFSPTTSATPSPLLRPGEESSFSTPLVANPHHG